MPAQITHKCLCFSKVDTKFDKSQRNSNAKIALNIAIIYYSN